MSKPTFSTDKKPPIWLMAVLAVCVCLVVLALVARQGLSPRAAAAPPEPTSVPTLEPTPEPTPTPVPTPEPTPEPDWSQPVAQTEAVEQESWFSDAVFIGDSRTDGLHLYSGITDQADFLDHTGVTVYEILDGKKVIRRGEEKFPILELLSQKQYGKIYIALGVNELGYKAPQDFGEACGRLVDAIRDSQPDARVYIQSIVPVNAADCKRYNQPYYVTNEYITPYNESLAAMAQEKKAFFVDVSQVMVDEQGELSDELSADGVHFKKAGYRLWLDYLTTHTGQGEPIAASTEGPSEAPAEAPAAAPAEAPSDAVA